MMVENLLILPIVFALADARAGDGSPQSWGARAAVIGRGLLKNPLIVAIIAGFLCSMLGLRLPAALAHTVDMFALASGGVALFVVGGSLVRLHLAGAIGKIVLVTVGKLLLHPLAVFLILLMLPPLDPILYQGALITACIPMLSIYPILGQRYDQEEWCAATMLVATVASFATISAMLWVLSRAAA